MIRQSSYSESCTSTVTATVHSEPSLTTLLLSSPKQMITKSPRSNHPPSRHHTRKHKSRPSTPSLQTHTSSSRLFFLLLHLVGVSTNLHERTNIWPGITAVHPANSIYLQRLNIESSLIDLIQAYESEDLLNDPFWFQDGEGRCLGIGGFGECGDTLWRVRRKKRRRVRTHKRQRRQSEEKVGENTVCVWPFYCEKDSTILQLGHSDGLFGVREEEGFALELVDVDDFVSGVHFSSQRRRRKRYLLLNDDERKYREEECLVSFPSEDSSSLQLGSCSSEEAWTWHINRDGVLVRGFTKSEKRKVNRRRWVASPITAGSRRGMQYVADADINMLCLHKVNITDALLLPCHNERKHKSTNSGGTLVGFSLVRYPSVSYRLSTNAPIAEESSPWITLEGSSSKRSENNLSMKNTISDVSISNHHIPLSRTSSQNHATSTKQGHVEVKSNRHMLHTGLDRGSPRKHDFSTKTSASHIRDAPQTTVDGLPFHGPNQSKELTDDKNAVKMKTVSLLHKEKSPQKFPKQLNNKENEDDSDASAHHRPIKIPVHPYIEASKDGIWVDPLTSLEYPTDLCGYLGQSKTEDGRHTLMGVGQYFRTAFNIKVYGAALYVSKRDVLADPKFARYATMSSMELQNRDDFYEHLMNMPAPGEDPMSCAGGFFDRTLMVKTNMQLSTDAMRKSLEADWSLLTDEMKTLIIESSFRERSADERMLARIQSKENSSNCSCGQKAPEEYAAEPSCCARGTELVFTWRKNGSFEVRLDGRVMDIFSRPDMARGIFAEYLNNDPISLDAKSHFADGFPFLLAPLAQVKGMSSAVPIGHDSTKKMERNTVGNPMFRLMMHPVNAMNSQAHIMSKWMQDGAAEISSTLDDALDNAVDIARGFSAEFERRRMELLDNAFALHDEINSLITSSLERDEGNTERARALVINSMHNSPTMTPTFQRHAPNEDMFSNVPDEIGVEIAPTMNFSHWLFFGAVHVYLVLLFVVSLQDTSYASKLVVKRKLKCDALIT